MSGASRRDGNGNSQRARINRNRPYYELGGEMCSGHAMLPALFGFPAQHRHEQENSRRVLAEARVVVSVWKYVQHHTLPARPKYTLPAVMLPRRNNTNNNMAIHRKHYVYTTYILYLKYITNSTLLDNGHEATKWKQCTANGTLIG